MFSPLEYSFVTLFGITSKPIDVPLVRRTELIVVYVS
jgi:hypothetical protein